MKLGIISNTIGPYGKMFVEAAKKRGHEAQIFPVSQLEVILDKEQRDVRYKGISLLEQDVILIRGMSNSPCIRGVFEIIANSGVKIVDHRLVETYDNNNKFYTYMKLQEKGLPFPKTYFIGHPEKVTLEKVLAELNTELPIIAKIGTSSQGRGVFLIESAKDFNALVNQLDNKDRHQLLFQEHLEHEGDYRVFVVGYNVIGGMFRRRKKTEYRANVAQGATATAVTLPREIKELAQKAAKAIHMEVAGVDIMQSNGNLYVIEINRSPQFKGLMSSTNIDVPDKIIEYCESLIK